MREIQSSAGDTPSLDPAMRGATPFTTLRNGYTAAVFGASGGIGAALSAILIADPKCARVFLGSRSKQPHAASPHAAKIRSFHFDLFDEPSIAHASEQLAPNEPIDVVLVATGFLQGNDIEPEKTWRSLSPDAFAQAFAINATGPALVAKHFMSRLNKNSKSIFAIVSARVGSISDNRLGGWHAYRASKAALNMIIRSLSIELALRNKQALCIGLHPGTVRTTLSAPFLTDYSHNQVFTPDESARHLLSVLDTLTTAESGRCFAWDGREVPP